jgi:hypothetical protein
LACTAASVIRRWFMSMRLMIRSCLPHGLYVACTEYHSVCFQFDGLIGIHGIAGDR